MLPASLGVDAGIRRRQGWRYAKFGDGGAAAVAEEGAYALRYSAACFIAKRPELIAHEAWLPGAVATS